MDPNMGKTTQNPQEARLLTDEFDQDPYPYYEYLRQRAPVAYDPELNAYLISRYADVRAVLTNYDVFSTRYMDDRTRWLTPGRMLTQLAGKPHAYLRGAVMRGITGETLDGYYRPILAELAHLSAARYRERGRVDLVREFGRDYALRAAMAVLGLSESDGRAVVDWTLRMAPFLSGISAHAEHRSQAIEGWAALTALLAPVIEEKLRHPGQDLLSVLFTAIHNGEDIKEEDVLAQLMNIFAAIVIPSEPLFALLCRNLMEDPGQLDLVTRDPDAVGLAIAETLRYTPPVQIIRRTVARDTELRGQHFSPGDLLLCLIGAANRDPGEFPDPDRFDVRRASAAERSFTAAARHLTFGTGLHFCIGAAFARCQIEAAAGAWLRGRLRVPGDRPAAPRAAVPRHRARRTCPGSRAVRARAQIRGRRLGDLNPDSIECPHQGAS
jgi:pulcherriminic acid synthase